MSEPVRRCVVCKTRRPQRELLRLRSHPQGKTLVWGPLGVGRSAYACPETCREQMTEPARLSRALKRPVHPDEIPQPA